MKMYLREFRLFRSSGGYLGRGPFSVKPGDQVCVLKGCNVPVLLRKEGSHYVHVGPWFVLGFMDGEAGKMIWEGKLKA